MSRLMIVAVSAFCLCLVTRVEPGLLAQARAVASPETSFSLRVARVAEGVAVSLDAARASLRAVTAELSQRLGVPVVVGPSLADDTVSANFSELALEVALPLLAPRVIIDQELRQGTPAAPRAVHLLSFADPEPPQATARPGSAQGFFIEGHTEDTPETARKSDPLQVSYDRGLLAISARQQPLADVVRVVADVLGVQVDSRVEARNVVDIDLPPMAPADALQRLSPLVRVLARFDLNSAEQTVVQITLAPPGAGPAR